MGREEVITLSPVVVVEVKEGWFEDITYNYGVANF